MLKLKKVSKSFKDKKILNNFNLEVKKGDKLVLFGKSGLGKTTIFRVLLGFTRPDKGEVQLEGKNMSSKDFWELRRRIAYVPQDSDIGDRTLRMVIDSVLSYKNNDHVSYDEKEVRKVLKDFDLAKDTLDKEVTDLSGGERQRAAIAIAVLLKKDIFLLDEPTSSLDKASKKRVIDHFINHVRGTVIIITHDKEWLRKGVKIKRVGGKR